MGDAAILTYAGALTKVPFISLVVLDLIWGGCPRSTKRGSTLALTLDFNNLII